MKKRVIACVLALAMTAGLLGGCGNGGNSGTDSSANEESSGDQIDLSVFWWGSQLRNGPRKFWICIWNKIRI